MTKIKSAAHYAAYKTLATIVRLSGRTTPTGLSRRALYHLNMSTAYNMLDKEGYTRERVYNVLSYIYCKECMDYIYDIDSYSDWSAYAKLSKKVIYEDYKQWIFAGLDA